MKEAIGNAFIFGLVITFIGIFILFFATSTSYTKAFKVKNKIIEIIEKHHNQKLDAPSGTAKEMDEAMAEAKMVVEGVYSAKAALGLARKYGVQIPIIEQVNQVLFENKPASETMKDLMTRDKKSESTDMVW